MSRAFTALKFKITIIKIIALGLITLRWGKSFKSVLYRNRNKSFSIILSQIFHQIISRKTRNRVIVLGGLYYNFFILFNLFYFFILFLFIIL